MKIVLIIILIFISPLFIETDTLTEMEDHSRDMGFFMIICTLAIIQAIEKTKK